MTGMNALRLHVPVDERKKLIKYDSLCCYSYEEYKQFKAYLTKHKVDYWIFNGDLYTYDQRLGEFINKFWMEE